MAVSEPISSGKRVLLYLASLLIPLFGIILGALYILRKDEEHTSVGTICLVIGVIAAVVVLASVGDAPRIRDLLEMAKETKEELAKQKPDVRTMFEDGIEPLFEKETEKTP